jgi:hypothetical protein
VRERDFPISTEQFRGIFEALGFRTETSRYEEPAEPVAPYIALCTAVYEGRLPPGDEAGGAGKGEAVSRGK